ncbi:MULTISPECIES: hypothetical protein [unclassified Rhizobium]|uniref:hypothetical protein n=1 Tax=unclassified Rhizobium TaxID=2613769 RepID=UPI0027D405F0|nr:MULTISPECIES: hypothetical protein [unclassified Rhizobium]MDQ4409116.1 hypothetical protein [Rhizobium sp. AN63]
MEHFSAIVNTFEFLRGNADGIHRSVKRIERLPAPSELSWCIEGAPLADFCGLSDVEHVTSLYLVECRKLTSFRGIATRFPKLKALWVYSCDQLTTFDGLQSLRELQALTIWPSFSGKIKVDTLSPLSDSTALTTLVFSGNVGDGSLKPLYGLKLLHRLFLSNNFSWQEFTQFEAKRPDVDFSWKGGVVYNANPATLACPSCGKAQALLTGKGIRLCCPDCDGDRLARHIKRYPELSRNS